MNFLDEVIQTAAIEKTIEMLQAFKEGKTIQWYDSQNSLWFKETSLKCLLHDLSNGVPVRIKTEPKYRPYKNAQEFLKDSKEHGPYMRLSYAREEDDSFIPERVNSNGITWTMVGPLHNLIFHSISYDQMLESYIWSDGSKCGALE